MSYGSRTTSCPSFCRCTADGASPVAHCSPPVSDFVCSTIALASGRERSSVRPETTMIELNMDSLTLVSVLAQVEIVYELELTADDTSMLLEATRVADLVRALESKIESEPPR